MYEKYILILFINLCFYNSVYQFSDARKLEFIIKTVTWRRGASVLMGCGYVFITRGASLLSPMPKRVASELLSTYEFHR